MKFSRAVPTMLLAAVAFWQTPAWAKAPHTAAQQAHERFILIDGGRNFRDAGGYRTDDGHRVKWGQFYRSGSLGSLTPQGMHQIDQLHVAAIVDLRSTQERARDLTNWLRMSGHGYWTRDYGISQGDMAAFFADPVHRSADGVRGMMMQAYRSLPREQAGSYRELFARLTSVHRGAVVVNCTAGKDRTGIATALVLTALGVPYQTVREDFLLSNGAPGMGSLQQSLSGPIAALPPEAAAPLVGVDGAYLDAAFDQMRKDYGSVEGYLSTELGVGPRDLATLRRRMLE
jgi:protein-tyrosine phosphatase